MNAEKKTAGKTAAAGQTATGAGASRYEAKAAAIRERAKEANEHEARELYIVSINTSEIYKSVVEPTINSLKRHAKRGKYSDAGAVVAWRNAADNLARVYCRIYAGRDVKPCDVFSVADRCAVAVMLSDSERETVFLGLSDRKEAK